MKYILYIHVIYYTCAGVEFRTHNIRNNKIVFPTWPLPQTRSHAHTFYYSTLIVHTNLTTVIYLSQQGMSERLGIYHVKQKLLHCLSFMIYEMKNNTLLVKLMDWWVHWGWFELSYIHLKTQKWWSSSVKMNIIYWSMVYGWDTLLFNV